VSRVTGHAPAAPTANWRAGYRAEHVPAWYLGRAHLAFTSISCLGVIALCAARIEDVQPLEWLTIPLTFLYANLVEYAGHRGPMHHRTAGLGVIFRRHTLQHHRFFTHEAMAFDSTRDYKAVLFPTVMILFFVGAFALPAGLLIAWLLTPNVAWLFVLTAVAYFLNYEWLHFAYHTPADSLVARLPGVARLRRLHTHHHNPALMQRYNFNITYPIGDRLFGTYFPFSGPSMSGRAIRGDLRSDKGPV
jgi:hypothetical protein